MSHLLILFDPSERIEFKADFSHLPAEERPAIATLTLSDDLRDRDIYEIARKLAEMLLEQLPQ